MRPWNCFKKITSRYTRELKTPVFSSISICLLCCTTLLLSIYSCMIVSRSPLVYEILIRPPVNANQQSISYHSALPGRERSPTPHKVPKSLRLVSSYEHPKFSSFEFGPFLVTDDAKGFGMIILPLVKMGKRTVLGESDTWIFVNFKSWKRLIRNETNM